MRLPEEGLVFVPQHLGEVDDLLPRDFGQRSTQVLAQNGATKGRIVEQGAQTKGSHKAWFLGSMQICKGERIGGLDAIMWFPTLRKRDSTFQGTFLGWLKGTNTT